MAEPQLGHQTKRRAAMAGGGGVWYVEGVWVGLSSLVLTLTPPKHVQMKLNNLTPAHTNTHTAVHRCRDAQTLLGLRGADGEHIMQTEALCVHAVERACELKRKIRLIKNQEKSQTVR